MPEENPAGVRKAHLASVNFSVIAVLSGVGRMQAKSRFLASLRNDKKTEMLAEFDMSKRARSRI